jgi:hypothetical protein
MLLSSTLESFQEYIDASNVFEARREEYDVQITSDGRPFANSGENTITLWGSSFRRTNPTSNQRKWDMSLNVSVNKRTRQPPDRLEKELYTKFFNSLSTITELLVYSIDNNSTILGLIKNNITLEINKIVGILNNLNPSSTEGYDILLSNAVAEAEVIGPIYVAEFITEPTPRDDLFFTGYDTKKSVALSTPSDILTPSGYSMSFRVQGPSIILPEFCS